MHTNASKNKSLASRGHGPNAEIIFIIEPTVKKEEQSNHAPVRREPSVWIITSSSPCTSRDMQRILQGTFCQGMFFRPPKQLVHLALGNAGRRPVCSKLVGSSRRHCTRGQVGGAAAPTAARALPLPLLNLLPALQHMRQPWDCLRKTKKGKTNSIVTTQ